MGSGTEIELFSVIAAGGGGTLVSVFCPVAHSDDALNPCTTGTKSRPRSSQLLRVCEGIGSHFEYVYTHTHTHNAHAHARARTHTHAPSHPPTHTHDPYTGTGSNVR